MSKQVVAQAKADLQAAGVDLSGNNGAFKIVMEAASRMPGFGVVDKPNGNHAEFEGACYSVDGMMDRAGVFYDCLIDGGGANEPTFAAGDPIDTGRWRQPKSVLGNKIPAPPTPPPSGSTVDNIWGFCQAAAGSMDVGHASLRELHGKVATLQETLARMEQQAIPLLKSIDTLVPKLITALKVKPPTKPKVVAH